MHLYIYIHIYIYLQYVLHIIHLLPEVSYQVLHLSPPAKLKRPRKGHLPVRRPLTWIAWLLAWAAAVCRCGRLMVGMWACRQAPLAFLCASVMVGHHLFNRTAPHGRVMFAPKMVKNTGIYSVL